MTLVSPFNRRSAAVAAVAVAAFAVWCWMRTSAVPLPNPLAAPRESSTVPPRAENGSPVSLPPMAERSPVAVDESAGMANGAVILLDPTTRTAPAGTVWVFESMDDGPQQIESELGRDGRVALPAGTWSASCRDPDLSVPNPFEVEPEQTDVLWLRRLRAMRVVVTSAGAAVPRANVRWASLPGEGAIGSIYERVWNAAWSADRLTDGSGEATLDGLVLPAMLVVTADGYEPTHVDVSIPTETLVIRLPPVDPPRFVRLDVRDALSHAPVPDPILTSWFGRVRHEARLDGTRWVEVPRTVDHRDFVEVRAEGYCAARVRWTAPAVLGERAALEVRLFPSCILRLDVVSTRASPVRVGVTVLDLPAEGDAPWLPEDVELPIDPVTLALPVDAEVEVVASDTTGRSAVQRLRTVAGENPVSLRLGSEDILIVATVTPDRAPTGDAQAKVWYDCAPKRETFRTDASGVLRVARATHVQSMMVSAAGKGAVLLRPQGAPAEVRRAGTVRIELGDAYDVKLRIVDEDEQPLPGVAVDVTGRLAESDRSLATEHPAWIALEQPRTWFSADGMGEVRCRLVAGTYDASFSLPVAGKADRVSDLYPRIGHRLVIDGPGAHQVEMPRLREVTVVAEDAVSGDPLAGITIRTDEESDVREIPGSRRELRLRASCREIVVASKGYVPQRFVIGSDTREIHARLLPGGAGTIELEGADLDQLVGASLTLVSSTSLEQRWYTRVVLRDAASQAVHIARDGVEVEIVPVEWGDRRWTFEPVHATWHAGATLRFRVSSEPR